MRSGDSLLFRHTQTDYVLAGVLLLAAGVIGAMLAIGAGEDGRVAMIVVAILLAGTGLVFTRLTCVVTTENLRWHFGAGWPRGSVPIREVASAKVVRNPWYYGWGLRITPVGILWNVSGRDAIEVELPPGTRFRIGTDRPAELVAAIERARRTVRGGSS